MRALAVILAGWAAGCATGRTHLEETSPRFSELAPQRIGVVVAGEPPRDAQVRIDRFGLRFPDAMGPDTRLPKDSGLAAQISARLAAGLVAHLEARGYEAVALDGAGARVGDLLRADDMDAVLVVAYRAASRWPVSEFQRTEIRQVGSLQEEVSQYNYTIERGLLLLPAAFLLDTRTSLRLWTHTNLGLQSDRVAMSDPVRRLGVIAEPDDDPSPLRDLAPQAVDRVLAFYFDSIPEASTGPRHPPTMDRRAELMDEAAVDRWRVHPRTVLDLGGGYARRAMTLEGPSSVDLDADAAFGGYWDVEVGLRVLGRSWMHGPRLALQRSAADYERRLVRGDTTQGATFEEATLRSGTIVDLSYVLARAWQPRRPTVIAAGLGPAVAVGIFDGEGLDAATRIQLGPTAEVEALWAGDALLVGPFVRASWMFDLAGGSAPAFAAGGRVGLSF